MDREIISPSNVHKPTTYYSHAIRVNELVYTAGQAPHIFNGEVWPKSDPEGQIRAAFENMAVVLHEANVEFKDIVRINVLLRNCDVIPAFWKVAEKYLKENRPAVTIAAVKGLAGPDYLLEFDAIVIKP